MYSVFRGIQHFFLNKLKPIFWPRRNLSFSQFTVNNIIPHVSNMNLAILDVGGKSGIQAKLLKNALQDTGNNSITLVILDIDKNSLKKGKELFKDLHFILGDAHYLSFRSEVFHLIYSYSLLEHLINPELAVSEQIRTVKNIIMSQIPNLHHFLEIHTKVPFLFLYPDKIKTKIIEATNPCMLINFNVNTKNIIQWFYNNGAGLINSWKIFHIKWFRILPLPHGYFLLFRKKLQ